MISLPGILFGVFATLFLEMFIIITVALMKEYKDEHDIHKSDK